MSSSNKGIWIVIGVGAALGVALAAYYVMVVGPRAERSEMTAQIDKWAVGKWYPARRCLVGSEPGAANGYDAIVLRSAIPGPLRPESGDCTGFFADLARPGAVSSGDPEVEADWRDVELAIGALANAYAGYSPDRHRDRESLGTALEKADAAYAKLREAAGLSASHAHESRRPPVAEVDAVTANLGESFTLDRIDVYGATLRVHGYTERGPGAVLVRGAEAITIAPAPPVDAVAEHRAVWASWSRAVEGRPWAIYAGALANDKLVDEGVEVWQGKDQFQAASPIFASGAESQRLLLFYILHEEDDAAAGSGPATTTYMASRSIDGGVSWQKSQSIGAGELVASLSEPIRGRLDLVWQAGDDLAWLAVDSPTAELAPRTLIASAGAVHRLDNCLGERASWWLSRGQELALYHLVADAASASRVADGELLDGIVGCDDSRLLGIGENAGNSVAFVVCTAERCRSALTVPVTADGQFAATLAGKDEVFAATLTSDLLVVWRSGKPEAQPAVLRVDGDEPFLRTLVEWEGVVHAVLADGGELRFLPLRL